MDAESSALQKLSTVDLGKGRHIYLQPGIHERAAWQIGADLGEYAVVALGLVLTDGDRKIMIKRSQAESLIAMDR